MLIVALLVCPGAHAADAPGTITILEGEALIYRGLGRLHAEEGVRLELGDIVETGSAAFMQVEFDNRSIAQLGPATRLMLASGGTRQKPARWLYLLGGWVKLVGAAADASAGPGFDLRSPLLEIPAQPGVIVLQGSPTEVMLFAERGELRLSEVQAGAKPVVLTLAQGDSYRRKTGVRGATAPGTTPTFVAEMPRFFRDSLPQRIDRFRDAPVGPKTAPDFVYADVEAWLKTEPSVRRPLMQRWRTKAKDAAFRSALVANLSAHPEWDPILFPEKYLPKPTPASQPGRAAEASAPTR